MMVVVSNWDFWPMVYGSGLSCLPQMLADRVIYRVTGGCTAGTDIGQTDGDLV